MATLMERHLSQQPVVSFEELRFLKLMEFAVERGPEAVMSVDWSAGGAQLAITYVNAAFTRIYGYAPEEVIERSPLLLCGPDTDRDILKSGLEGVLRNGHALIDLIHYRKDRTPIWLELSIIPVTDANGAITSTLTFSRELAALRPRTYAPNRYS